MEDNLVENNYPLFKVTYTVDGEQFEKEIVAKGVDRVKQNVYISCKEDNPLAEVVILRVELIK
ncbi:hypothetical protein AXI76_gp044 [Pseudoalteromonas phage H101]|uniref:Uncharacterized protein n=1 Tax=Pseudoalteromonas phage H101 TaxID=1654919 RepID=A0A0H4J215_9CAUD|nr:hypothetical protein AXI76_gp044 [Pseudoalteromonas phage H101]AKO60945.1 hypothetical protein [Pseudoalteromonas phage H101]